MYNAHTTDIHCMHNRYTINFYWISKVYLSDIRWISNEYPPNFYYAETGAENRNLIALKVKRLDTG